MQGPGTTHVNGRDHRSCAPIARADYESGRAKARVAGKQPLELKWDHARSNQDCLYRLRARPLSSYVIVLAVNTVLRLQKVASFRPPKSSKKRLERA